MAKILYAGTASDFTVAEVAVLASPDGVANVLKLNPGAPLEAWNAGEDGSQVTALALFTGDYTVPGGDAPSGIFTSTTSSTFLFWAEDTNGSLYVCGQGDGVLGKQRWKADPVNQYARLQAVEALNPIPMAQKGVAGGVVPLDGSNLVDPSFLPGGTGGVASVNSETGAVVLNEANTGFVPNTRKVDVDPGLTVTNSGKLDQNIKISPSFGSSAGTIAPGNHSHGGFTTSPRPIAAQVLSIDAPIEWRTAAAADPYTWVCDGTNDGVQAQLAADAAAPWQSRNPGMPAGAKQLSKVAFSGGRFNIGAEGIAAHTAVRFEGQGKGTEIRSVGCNQVGLFRLSSPSDHLVEIADMYLYGNSGAGGTCSAIDFDMTSSGNTSSYPDTNPDSDHIFENLFIDEFRGTNRHGVYLHSTGTANNRGNMIRNLQIRDCTGGNGIFFDGASDSYIEACHVGGSGDTGYRIAGGNTKMIGNKSFYSSNCGIWVTSGRVNITGHEAQDDSTGVFLDGVPGTAVGLVIDTCDVAGLRLSNDRVQAIGVNIFVRSGGRYTTQQRGIWYDGSFTNCAVIGNVENANMTTPISGTVPTGTNLVTVS